MKIFVGNLSPETSEEDLRETFNAFGQVASVTVLRYKHTGQPRGSGFVEMPDEAEAKSAITRLSYQTVKGRRIMLNEARDQTEGARASGARGRAAFPAFRGSE